MTLRSVRAGIKAAATHDVVTDDVVALVGTVPLAYDLPCNRRPTREFHNAP